MSSLIMSLAFFALCFFIVIKSANYTIRFAIRLARIFELSEFIISFCIVAIISALPEAIISIMANIRGEQGVAIMALLGSNVVDLTLVFGIIAIVGNGVKIESKVLRKDALYLVLLVLPLLFGMDGVLTRIEGIVLMISGLLFFYTLTIEKGMFSQKVQSSKYGSVARVTIFLVITLLVMVIASDFTVRFLSDFASGLGLPDFLVALFIISIGTCLPELLFSLRAIKTNHSGLALGDILGTVIIDATIVLGLVAVIHPIQIDPTLFRVTAFFNAISACVLVYYLKFNKVLTRVEGMLLILFYSIFVFAEILLQIH